MTEEAIIELFAVLKEPLEKWARETGFVKRKGTLTPHDFLALMTVGQMGMKHPSLAGMVAAIEANISRVALHQRFTANAAAFLYKCLNFILNQQVQQAVPVQTEVLDHFNRVFIVDSSSWDVNEKLRGVLPGSGGSASDASCKIQVAYEYIKGELAFLDVTPGILPDNRFTDNLPALLSVNDLLLIDQGYFKLDTFAAILAKGAFFLTRFLVSTTLTNADSGEAIDLRKTLKSLRANTGEIPVVMGPQAAKGVTARLICLRVSQQVAEKRRKRLIKDAAKKGRTVSELHLELCAWTMLVTNIPQAWLPLEMCRALYTLRWQIELLFKQLKSILRIHNSDTANEHRLRCELYGKMIIAVLVHRLHAAANSASWNTSRIEISMDKFYKRIQERAFTLLAHLRQGLRRTAVFLRAELKSFTKHCVKSKQNSRMTTLEMLEAQVDPALSVRSTTESLGLLA